MKKTRICLLLAIILLCVSACGDAKSWTDRDLTSAKSVKIVCYGTTEKSYEKMIYTTSEEEIVRNICNTFSLLALEKTRTAETLEIAYCIYFQNDAWDEIDHIYILSDYRTVQNSAGRMFRITDEMDLDRHIRKELLPKMEFLQLILPDED